MLERHLGGTAPAPPDVALQRYLIANPRLCSRSPSPIAGCNGTAAAAARSASRH